MTLAELQQYALILVALSVPLGMLGSLIEHIGAIFEFQKWVWFGQKMEDLFTNLPQLLGRKRQ